MHALPSSPAIRRRSSTSQSRSFDRSSASIAAERAQDALSSMPAINMGSGSLTKYVETSSFASSSEPGGASSFSVSYIAETILTSASNGIASKSPMAARAANTKRTDKSGGGCAMLGSTSLPQLVPHDSGLGRPGSRLTREWGDLLTPNGLSRPLKMFGNEANGDAEGEGPVGERQHFNQSRMEERMRKAGRLREHDQDTGETKSVVSHLSFETTIEVLDSHGGVPSKALFDAVDEVSC